jgi:hypothetical protein
VALGRRAMLPAGHLSQSNHQTTVATFRQQVSNRYSIRSDSMEAVGMLARLSRSFIAVVAASSLVAGCAHHAPDVVAANGQGAVDVAAEHPTLNRLSDICTGRDALCILAGFAILGGTIAAIKSNDD